MSSQPNFCDTPFDQKSPQPPEEGVLRRHIQTHSQTDGLNWHSACSHLDQLILVMSGWQNA